MSTWTHEGPAFDASTEVLRSVRIISGVDRSRNTTSHYTVTARIVDGAFSTDIGSWAQSSYNLAKGTRRELLTDRHKNKRIPSGSVLRVHVAKAGAPADIHGTSVEFVFEKMGGTADNEMPLIGTGDGGDPLTTRINRAKFGSRTAVVQLTEPVAAATLPTPGIQSDRDDTGATYTSASFADGAVSVTVPVTSGRVAYVQVVAAWSYEPATDAVGSAECAIGDGTTDHNEIEQATTGTGDNRAGSTNVTQSITEETTYTLRIKKLSGANALVEDQTITALYVEAAS